MRHTIKSLLKQAATQIDRKEAALLLSFFLKKDESYLIAHPEQHISFWQQRHFFSAIKKRKKGLPIAYITGEKYFYGRPFWVNEATLVPRPETELLVERARAYLEKHKNALIIDVGTGSGCIAITLAAEMAQKNTGFASDISAKAIRTAKKNSDRHHTDILFRKGSLLFPFLSEIQKSEMPCLFAANLPYLTEKQFQDEPSIQHEPKSALVAPDQGLALYKTLLDQIKELDKKEWIALFEIDPDQSDLLTQHINKTVPEWTVAIYQDLAGHDRVVEISR